MVNLMNGDYGKSWSQPFGYKVESDPIKVWAIRFTRILFIPLLVHEIISISIAIFSKPTAIPADKSGEPVDTSSSEGSVLAGIAEKPKIFGGTLDRLQEENGEPPSIVTSLIEKIEENIKEEGIYRLSPVNSKKNKLIKCFEDGDDYSKTLEVHVYTGVLKEFFRELEDPLIPEDIENTLNVENIEKFKVELKSLNTVHYNTLKAMIIHLVKVAANSEENKMKASNLAMVFSQSFFSRIDDPMAELAKQKLRAALIKYMIENCGELFVDEPEQSSGSS
ncbi:rho GTPase-activating protein [Chlamydiales bacterium]|nr:rho GTPase-activating protein [Chlamydiales bacterium]